MVMPLVVESGFFHCAEKCAKEGVYARKTCSYAYECADVLFFFAAESCPVPAEVSRCFAT